MSVKKCCIALCVIIFIGLLHGCATIDNSIDYAKRKVLVNDSDGKPIDKPEVIYERGMAHLKKKQYDDAIKAFNEVEELYPFSQWAQQAMIISAYINYHEENYTVAEATMERFIDSYRNYKYMSYAYYLKAMSQYRQIRDIRHDHEVAAKAYASMLALAARFPHSVYARDIENRILLARYYLAAKDVEVGRFYMKTRQYLGAMLRFNKYLSEYPDTYYTPEVLYRLVVCSEVLGLPRETKKYYALLSYNFPYSNWHSEAEKFLKARPRLTREVAAHPIPRHKPKGVGRGSGKMVSNNSKRCPNGKRV